MIPIRNPQDPSSPHLISPHLTSPHLISPHLTSSHLSSSHLTSPHLTSPHLTSPHLTSPHLTSPLFTSSHLISTANLPAQALVHSPTLFAPLGNLPLIVLLSRARARARPPVTCSCSPWCHVPRTIQFRKGGGGVSPVSQGGGWSRGHHHLPKVALAAGNSNGIWDGEINVWTLFEKESETTLDRE